MIKHRVIDISRLTVLVTLLALMLTLTAAGWLDEPFNLTRWFIQILPLAAFVPVLQKGSLRPYQWLCFVIMLYFMMGVLTVFSPGQKYIGILITFCCVLLFCSAIFYIHQQQKANKS